MYLSLCYLFTFLNLKSTFTTSKQTDVKNRFPFETVNKYVQLALPQLQLIDVLVIQSISHVARCMPIQPLAVMQNKNRFLLFVVILF